MLNGEYGPAAQKAMQILVALGDVYDAEKMAEVSNVHMPGSSVVVAGDAGLSFVEEMADKKACFKAFTTLNPAAVDLAKWSEIGFSKEAAEKQFRLTEAYRRMGGICTHTCTPYLIGNVPRTGENVAWGESSAIAFSNSVLGARTNREGGPSALASSITGRTPLYGYHLQENRRGQVHVRVKAKLSDIPDYGALGYHVGMIAKEAVPVFEGIPLDVNLDRLKMLSAALASSGAVALYHIVGITPEASTLQQAFHGGKPSEAIDFGDDELRDAKQKLSKATGSKVDMVCFGCPHASIGELREISEVLHGRKVHSEVRLWICTSTAVKSLADRMGYTEIIEMSGGTIVCDTCPVLAPTKDFAKRFNVSTIATNSAKLAHYAPGQCNLMPFYGNLKRCVEATAKGVWGK